MPSIPDLYTTGGMTILQCATQCGVTYGEARKDLVDSGAIGDMAAYEEDIRALVCDMYDKQKMHAEAIEEKIGVPRSTVSRIISKDSRPRTNFEIRNPFSEQSKERDELIRLRKEGLSIRKIAKALGHTTKTIYTALRHLREEGLVDE